MKAVLETRAVKAIQAEIPVQQGILKGQLAIPQRAQGIVLFAHGSGSNRLSPRNHCVAHFLQQAQVATLVFDLLTGREQEDDRETARMRFDVGLLAHRLVEATRWVAHQRRAMHLGIGYFGSGTGAAAALTAAASLGPVVDAIVCRGGRAELAQEALPRVQAPTLFLVGEFDDMVLQLNRRALASMICQKEIRMIPGATHSFDEPGALDEVARFAAKWFQLLLARR